MRQKLILCVIVFNIFACTQKKNENIDDKNVITIDVDINTSDIQVTDYFQYDSYIALETTEESIIAQIRKIEFFQQKIYVLDPKQGCIFIFDNKGRFLDKWDKKGQGIGEYVSLTDFFIDKQKGIIHLYDRSLGHVLHYDFSGKFIDKSDVEAGFAFTKLINNNWLFYLGNGIGNSNNYYNLLLFDESYKQKKQYLPFNKNMLGRLYTIATTASVFLEYDDTLYIHPLLSNTIYAYDILTDQIDERYKINFPNIAYSDIDPNSTLSEVENFRAKVNRGEIVSNIHNFYKTGDIIFFYFFYRGQRFFCLFDEKLNTVKCVSKRIFDNNGLFLNPLFIFLMKRRIKY